MVKNCDLGLENAAFGLRPRAVFARPRSQFFAIRTSQPANNIYIFSVVNRPYSSPYNGFKFSTVPRHTARDAFTIVWSFSRDVSLGYLWFFIFPTYQPSCELHAPRSKQARWESRQKNDWTRSVEKEIKITAWSITWLCKTKSSVKLWNTLVKFVTPAMPQCNLCLPELV